MSPMNSSQMGLVDGVSQVIYERFNGPASLTQVDSNRAFISLRKNDGPLSTLTMIDDDAQKVEVCFSFYEDIRFGANNSPLVVRRVMEIIERSLTYDSYSVKLPCICCIVMDCWSRSIAGADRSPVIHRKHSKLTYLLSCMVATWCQGYTKSFWSELESFILNFYFFIFLLLSVMPRTGKELHRLFGNICIFSWNSQ